MQDQQYEKKDRAPYEPPDLKCHGDAKALTQTIMGNTNRSDNRQGLNLKT